VSNAEKVYAEWVGRAVADLGLDSMNTPIKVQLHTGVGPLKIDHHYDKPRYLFDAMLSGLIDADDIEEIKIAGETYMRANGQWVRAEDVPPLAFPVEAEDEPYEEVDHPKHYEFQLDGKRYDAIDLIEAMALDFHTGNALKYMIRAGAKPGADHTTDLRKAAWYLNRRADFLDGLTQ
jgi:hypothetical protein